MDEDIVLIGFHMLFFFQRILYYVRIGAIQISTLRFANEENDIFIRFWLEFYYNSIIYIKRMSKTIWELIVHKIENFKNDQESTLYKRYEYFGFCGHLKWF